VLLAVVAIVVFGVASGSGSASTKIVGCSDQDPCTLTVSVSGPGHVSGSEISCPDTCTQTERVNPLEIILTATPDNPYSMFDGWGGSCSGGGTCTVWFGVEQRTFHVSASFSGIPEATLTVSSSGSGGGAVSSTPAGIDCGSTCSAPFPLGTSVTLTAAADSSSAFGGWGGDCGGTASSCTVPLDKDRSVTATFVSDTVTVTKAGTGSGTVSSVPAGVDCGTACSARFAPGTALTLTAAADAGSAFSGWGGACMDTAPACVVTTESDLGVTATFTRLITPTHTRLLAKRTKTGDCRMRGPLPDRRCSPGAIYTDATLDLICAPGYTAKVRSVPASEKNAVYAEYGIPRSHYGRSYEIDEIVPVGLGGSSNIANLYPEAASNPSPGFHVKDKLETKLHQLVCSHELGLAIAQRAIASNWPAFYKKIFGATP
jgi:hypothetical protein